MANPPYFPLYPQDFLGKTSRLSNEKFGAYCRLLFNSWLEPLVDDMDELTQITRQDAVKTRQLLEKYFVLENGIWINRRMEKERVKAEDKIAKATAAANARWNANGNADADANAYADGYATGDAQGDAPAMPSQNSDLRTKKEELKTQNPEPKSQKKEEPPISPQGGSREKIPYSEIISDLNEKSGRNYRADSAATKRLIKARWEDGFGLEDFKTVHSNQCVKWLNNPEMCEYLRPTTLYNASKFEGYLNSAPNLYQRGELSKSGAQAVSNLNKAFEEIENEIR